MISNTRFGHWAATTLAALSIAVFSSGCYQEIDTHLEIRADGTAQIIMRGVMDRQLFEQQLSQFANAQQYIDDESAFDGFSDDAEDNTAGEVTEPASEEATALAESEEVADPTVLWNEQLAAIAKQPQQYMGLDADSMSMIVSDYNEQQVTVTWTIDFADLATMVRVLPRFMENDNVGRVRLSPVEGAEGMMSLLIERFEEANPEHIAMMVMQFPDMTIRSSYTFPGPVSEAEGWTIDGDNPRHISMSFSTSDADAVEKITAINSRHELLIFAANGLSSDGMPLDSELLMEAEGDELHPDIVPTLDEDSEAVTEDTAVDPAERVTVLAQARILTSTTVNDFSEATTMVKQSGRSFSNERSHIKVEGSLFPPEGRRVVELEEAIVVKAIDDQDRPLKLFPRTRRDDHHYRSFSHSSDSNITELAALEFSLELPHPGEELEAIEELHAHATITTCAQWITRSIILSEHEGGAIALDDMEEGMSLLLRKPTVDGRSHQVDIMLRGPAEVKDIRAELTFSNIQRHSRNVRREASRVHDDQHQRRMTLEARLWGSSDDEDPGELTLILHFPKDLQRQQVTFVLEALDM